MPKAGSERQWEMIYGEFGPEEIELIGAGFHMQSGGKIPEPQRDAADAWLRRAAKRSPRAVRAISKPTPQELSKQALYKKR